jgi:hypothetical protein
VRDGEETLSLQDKDGKEKGQEYTSEMQGLTCYLICTSTRREKPYLKGETIYWLLCSLFCQHHGHIERRGEIKRGTGRYFCPRWLGKRGNTGNSSCCSHCRMYLFSMAGGAETAFLTF